MGITNRAMRFLRSNLLLFLLAFGWAGMLFFAAKIQNATRDYRAYLEQDYKAKERSADELRKQPIENLVKVLLIHQDQRKRDTYLARLAGETMSEANGGLWLAWLVGTLGFAGTLYQRRRERSQPRHPVPDVSPRLEQ